MALDKKEIVTMAAAALAYNKDFAFNAICPYYTMFPLEFPLDLLKRHKVEAPTVYDPFCGRGTTIYAARKLGLKSYGLDISPIATAIAQAKLASAEFEDVIALARKLITKVPKEVPDNPFFQHAFSETTLLQVCSLREGLMKSAATKECAILRAAALGCLHGPLSLTQSTPSYFSNQMPRTFASKPDYSIKFWRERGLIPPNASVIDVLMKKLVRISDLNAPSPSGIRNIKCLDARRSTPFRRINGPIITITSPPYYGMKTYIQDQWLRMWFLGGGESVEYEKDHNQLCHTGHERFTTDLAKVWINIGKHAQGESHLYVRFGSIPSAKSDAREIMKASLEEAKLWRLVSVRSARTSHSGRRQADYMGRKSEPVGEFDFHAVLR